MNEPRDQHDDLRELFADATSDIRPQGSLDDILERTKKVDPMTRRWFLPVIAAAAVIGLAIGGAAWIANDSDDPKGGGGQLGTPPSPSATTPTEGSGPINTTVPIYWVGETRAGQRLFQTFMPQENVCPETDCLTTVAAARAVLGSATDSDFTTLWPESSDLIRVTFTDDLITVDLSGPVHDRPADMTAAQANLSIQQVIYTVQAGIEKGRLPVQFTIDGKHTDTVLGQPASEPLSADAEMDILAPVQITSLYDEERVSPGDLKVTGVAATFEATVVWELLVGGDAVVDQGHTMAQECCKLTPYSFTIKNLQPGSYTLVVHDTDESGGEGGGGVNQDTKEIVVE